MEILTKKNAQDTYLTLKKATQHKEYIKAFDKMIEIQRNYLKQKYNDG